eukprot:5247083-Amphidinium_carterae.1
MSCARHELCTRCIAGNYYQCESMRSFNEFENPFINPEKHRKPPFPCLPEESSSAATGLRPSKYKVRNDV